MLERGPLQLTEHPSDAASAVPAFANVSGHALQLPIYIYHLMVWDVLKSKVSTLIQSVLNSFASDIFHKIVMTRCHVESVIGKGGGGG